MKIILGLWLAAAVAVWAQESPPPSVLASDARSCFSRVEGTPRLSSAVVDVDDGPGFTWAWRLTTRELGTNTWDLRIRCFATLPVRKGDVGVAKYWIRSTREEPAISHFVVEQSASPYSKSADWTAVAATPAWKQVNVAFRWDNDYTGAAAATQYNLSFWAGLQVQEIEIGGFELRNYGPDVDVRTLNLVGFPYDGAEAGAAWRAAAEERIEKFRKADIEVTVRNAAGEAVAGAPVKVRMKKHGFGFATAVDAGTLNANTPDAQRYREELLRNFNKVAIENDLKWPFYETWAAGRFDTAERWLSANGLSDIHAHVLVWPGKRNLPPDVVAMLDAQPVNQDALRQRVNAHIERMMTVTRGRVTEWDVLNEPFDNKDLQAALGNAEMAEWFKQARRHNPDVRLFLNDYDIIERGGFLLPHIKYTLDTLRFIKENGGPVDGFGFQSHFSRNLTGPERIYELFDLFAQEVEHIQVTEFDVNVADEELQAQFTRDFLTLAFSHPKMNGFTMWGFWAGRHWLQDGAMFRRDWSAKKNLVVWRDLVFGEWWTDVEGATGEDGVFRVRGFLGDYEAAAGDGAAKAFTLVRGEAARVEIVLP